MKEDLKSLLRAHRGGDPKTHPRLSRVQKIVQQESNSAVIFGDLDSWNKAVSEAGLKTKVTGDYTVAYNEVGDNMVFHGYYPHSERNGYLDLRASYGGVRAMVKSIKECLMNSPKALLSETALTSYFKRNGMKVDVEGDNVTIWTQGPDVYADAMEIACNLGDQIGDIKTAEEKNPDRYGIKFKLLQASYPSADLPDGMGKPVGNPPKPVKPGINENSKAAAIAQAAADAAKAACRTSGSFNLSSDAYDEIFAIVFGSVIDDSPAPRE